MKVVGVFRGQHEIESLNLEKPFVLIGRSPTNDLVLRAPGVAPIHFIIEWAGVGNFDPSQNHWSVLKISSEGQTAEEGIMLSEEAVEIDGFRFELRDDRMAPQQSIGGQVSSLVKENFTAPSVLRTTKELLLEAMLLRKDSQAIEEITHVSLQHLRSPKNIFQRGVAMIAQAQGEHVKLAAADLPTRVLTRNLKMEKVQSVDLRFQDFYSFEFGPYEAYFRLVEKQNLPTAKRTFFGDVLLRGIFFATLLVVLLLVGVSSKLAKVSVKEEVKVPPRIATIEIKELQVPEPPPPAPAPPAPEVKPEPVKAFNPTPEPVKNKAASHSEPLKIGMDTSKANTKPGEAAAPKFARDLSKPGKVAGLNNAAKTGDTNQIGVLGAFGKAKKGPGVNADLLINQGVQSDSVSSNDTKSSVLLRNPPSGTLGDGTSGDPKGGPGGGDLAGAQTTIGGGTEYNPASSGPIARKGGRGSGTGTSLESGGNGLASGSLDGTSDAGVLDGPGLNVSGGLDAESVRRVIQSNRSRIRTCYERALLGQPGLSGRISYSWRISPTGAVSTAEVVKSTVGSTSLEGCILEVIKQMSFPRAENGQATQVTYPYIFKSRN
jgi:TonB family protein